MDNASLELADATSRTRTRRTLLVAAWLFPILCWFVATLFLGGALGKSSDDYSINLRDPATDAVPHPFNPRQEYPYFLRPLHMVLCYSVGTLWPAADRSVHIGVAMMHGVACIFLFLVMRDLTRTRLAAALAAMVFMVLPFHGEVAFWFCTTSTAIGLSCALGGILVGIRHMRRGGRPIVPLGWVFLLTFAAACFYEQAAAASAAILFLCLAASPRKRSIGRAVMAAAAAGSACVLYAAALLTTAPKNARGGTNSLVTPADLHERFATFLETMLSCLVGERARHVLLGSVELGWSSVCSARGALAGAVLAASAVLWLFWATRPETDRSRHGADAVDGASGPVLLFLAGGAIFVAAWLPVLCITQQKVELRTAYVPLAGAALSFAACLDGLLHRTRRAAPAVGAWARWTSASLGLAAIGLGVVGLIGFQSLFRARSLLDQRELAALRRIVPDPPKFGMFVPFQNADAPVNTGYPLFDCARVGVFETPWSAHAAIQFSYHRDDLSSISFCRGPQSSSESLTNPVPLTMQWSTGLDPVHNRRYKRLRRGEGARIPWTDMIPFVLDAEGRVRLIEHLSVERTDYQDFRVEFPAVRAVLDAAASRGKHVLVMDFAYYEADPQGRRPDMIPLKFWEMADGSPAKFEMMSIWSSPRGLSPGAPPREAGWVAAGYREHAAMSIPLPPSDREEKLLLRATIAEYDTDPGRNPFARVEELVVTMASAPERPLAVLRLDPAKIRSEGRWLTLVASLPPRRAVAGDRLVLTPRLAGNEFVQLDPSALLVCPPDSFIPILPVWVTRGYEQAPAVP